VSLVDAFHSIKAAINPAINPAIKTAIKAAKTAKRIWRAALTAGFLSQMSCPSV
jgi:hypothetical protein